MNTEKIPENLGKYRIIKPLGAGGYAEVFLAEDTELERRVALKILKPQWMHMPDFVHNFEQEAKAAAKFQHTNIVTVHDRGEIDGRYYIAIEYINGGTLEQRLKQSGPLSPTKTAEFVHQVAAALDYAHNHETHKTIHRDVKPSNILIHSDTKGLETAVLADFGIAKAVQDTSGRHSTTAVGTGPYMAPEQIFSPGNLDHRIDIYALGIVAYEMLTGEVPFQSPEGASFMQLARMIEQDPPPSLRDKGIYSQIEIAIFKALAKHPDDRYESAGIFAAALDEAVRVWKEESQEQEALTTIMGLAGQAMDQGHWQDAVRYYRRYLGLAPSRIAREQLQKAEREIKLQELRNTIRQCETDERWQDVLDALGTLLSMTPDDTAAQQQLHNARLQLEMQNLYNQAQDALAANQIDEAIQFARQIESRLPKYRDAQTLLKTALTRKVNQLSENALLAIGRRDAVTALELVQNIKETDPNYQYYSESKVNEIIALATAIQQEEQQAEEKRRLLLIVGGIVLVLILIAGSVWLFRNRSGNGDQNNGTPIAIGVNTPLAVAPLPTEIVLPSTTPSPTQTPSPTWTPTASLSPTTVPSAMPSATITPSATARPSQTPTSTPTPALSLIVLQSATLYAGPDTSYSELGYLDIGATLIALGRDERARWWYVRTPDNKTGWVWGELVEGSFSPELVAVVTPAATLSATITSLPNIVNGTPITLQANWPTGNANCSGTGFSIDYWVEATGGNGVYTYLIEGVVRAANISGGTTLRLSSAHGSYVATLTVTSGGQTYSTQIFVSRTDYCDN